MLAVLSSRLRERPDLLVMTERIRRNASDTAQQVGALLQLARAPESTDLGQVALRPLQDRDGQIRSPEEKHQHARDALEHYRRASKEQREQEQRRHEAQVQQLQLEMRQLQQTLIVKQDELTQLNRDNARLLTEARQQQKEQHAQQRHVAQQTQALETLQGQLQAAERARETVEQRYRTVQGELKQLKKTLAQVGQSRQPRVLKEGTQKPPGQTPPAAESQTEGC